MYNVNGNQVFYFHFLSIYSHVLYNIKLKCVFRIGNTFEPKSFTEDLKNTRVYLLLWNVIFKLCSKLESQERYKYISHLK